jgi:hypothetical protein
MKSDYKFEQHFTWLQYPHICGFYVSTVGISVVIRVKLLGVNFRILLFKVKWLRLNISLQEPRSIIFQDSSLVHSRR